MSSGRVISPEIGLRMWTSADIDGNGNASLSPAMSLPDEKVSATSVTPGKSHAAIGKSLTKELVSCVMPTSFRPWTNRTQMQSHAILQGELSPIASLNATFMPPPLVPPSVDAVPVIP